MLVASSNLNNVQEAGDYPFRDGRITISLAEIAVWRSNPRAIFRTAQAVRSIKRLHVGARTTGCLRAAFFVSSIAALLSLYLGPRGRF
jgi:hypothetical protein